MNYSIAGAPFPVVECTLNAGESMVCQKGAMVWMSNNMQMQTSAGGGIGSMLGRAFTGESIFQNIYTAQGGPGLIAFGASVPGNILAFDVTPNLSLVGQKGAYLASEPGVQFETFFQKKIAAGIFGGEGFIMQRYTGSGKVFLEIDGSVVEHTLGPGESMLIDTGYLAAMESSCTLNVEMVKGVGNVLFGGEGLLNTKVTGPGKIWLQTMPVVQFAQTLAPFMPVKRN